ncbi:hypothetical protein HYG86_05905 [Alkalicella caledoniensis]|uniref:Uncharacterized protein n=1 Tax=Alkalicella caledoniensis TaxID=2731377 RepID=A0A7G9W6M7_ALKCA|nr:hypothetical protein [Alkalicella caledoniensis]QNO14339.1 hypothetical protein HYG86_05905 [Alkalicella caledoniensis]
MKKELKKVRNTRIIAGITQISFFSILLNNGLCVIAIFIGSLAVLSFLAAYKSHKSIIRNYNN